MNWRYHQAALRRRTRKKAMACVLASDPDRNSVSPAS